MLWCQWTIVNISEIRFELFSQQSAISANTCTSMYTRNMLTMSTAYIITHEIECMCAYDIEKIERVVFESKFLYSCWGSQFWNLERNQRTWKKLQTFNKQIETVSHTIICPNGILTQVVWSIGMPQTTWPPRKWTLDI